MEAVNRRTRNLKEKLREATTKADEEEERYRCISERADEVEKMNELQSRRIDELEMELDDSRAQFAELSAQLHVKQTLYDEALASKIKLETRGRARTSAIRTLELEISNNQAANHNAAHAYENHVIAEMRAREAELAENEARLESARDTAKELEAGLSEVASKLRSVEESERQARMRSILSSEKLTEMREKLLDEEEDAVYADEQECNVEVEHQKLEEELTNVKKDYETLRKQLDESINEIENI